MQDSHTNSSAPCPVCEGQLNNWLRKNNRQIQRCHTCKLLLVPDGVMITSEGVSIYEEETPIFMVDGNESYYFNDLSFKNFENKLQWVQKYVQAGGKILDIGANFGYFLKVAESSFQTIGFDVSPTAVAWSREHLGVNNHVASIYDIPSELQGPYDAITLWDVIEHLPEPIEALKKIHTLLKPRGLLFLSTPNTGSVTAKLLGKHWHYLDPIQHLIYFNPKNLQKILLTIGFKTISTHSCGHFYKVEYIMDRLCYLHQEKILGKALKGIQHFLTPLSKFHVYINLGDVMGVLAQRLD